MRQEVVWVLMLALGLRAGAALAVQTYLDQSGREFLIPGDANGYWELGQRIAAGEPYAAHDPPRRVMRMPGYPAFLALAIRVFGRRLIGVRLLQAVAGTVACWLVFLLGRELTDERTGLLAATLAAVLPTFVGFGALALTETLFATTLLASLLLLALLARVWGDRADSFGPVRWPLAVAAGVSVAVAVYVRPSWLLAGPGFCLLHCLAALIRTEGSAAPTTGASDRASQGDVTSPDSSQTLPGRRSRLQIAVLESVAVFAGMAIALLPWTLRNRAITGHPIVTTLWVGPSLYDGLNPEATGESNMRFFERDNLLRSMSEYEMDREYRRRAWEFARRNPARAITLGFAKLVRYWSPWPNAAQFQSWWLRAGSTCLFLLVFGAALAGGWKRRRDLRCLLLTAAPVFYFAAIHSVFVGSLRYRLPAEYPLLILSAAGLLALAERCGVVFPAFFRRLPGGTAHSSAEAGGSPAVSGTEPAERCAVCPGGAAC